MNNKSHAIDFLLLLSALIVAAKCDSHELMECWATNSSDCLIRAIFYSAVGQEVEVRIDCREDEEIEETLLHHSQINSGSGTAGAFLNRFGRIENVSMDGCYAKLPTLGIDFLPGSGEKIRAAVFKQFNLEEIWSDAFHDMRSLERLEFRSNRINKIGDESFSGLKKLKVLIFEMNDIINLSEKAFEPLPLLEELTIRENDLIVWHLDLISNSKLRSLTLSVNELNLTLLEHLPPSLKVLNVSQTSFDTQNASIRNPGNLATIWIAQNNLSSVEITDNQTVRFLNLSGNRIKTLSLKNFTELEVLDLSNNYLKYLNDETFKEMYMLREAYIQNNKLTNLDIQIFRWTRSLNLLDISDNHLAYVEFGQDHYRSILHPSLKIHMDNNPWNCTWLLDLSSQHPEIYQLFKYQKYISKINVNGLQCSTYSRSEKISFQLKTTEVPKTKWISPSFYEPLPGQKKRNHKINLGYVIAALVIGVALLLVLLYMWIKCQQIFHLSFYRRRATAPADHFDVVREIPTVISKEYEMPIQCSHEVFNPMDLGYTYDQIPEPIRVYEEIHDDCGVIQDDYDSLNHKDYYNSEENTKL